MTVLLLDRGATHHDGLGDNLTGDAGANTLWGGSNILSMLPIIRAAYWQPDPVYEAPILEAAEAGL